MDSGNEKPPQPTPLAEKISKYDVALGTVSDVEESIGTDQGPFQYDISGIDPTMYPEYHAQATGEVRGVKLRLANITFVRLLEQRDALSDLQTRATMAEQEFQAAEAKYLSERGTDEDGAEFDLAYAKLKAVEREVAQVFTPRETIKPEEHKMEDMKQESLPEQPEDDEVEGDFMEDEEIEEEAEEETAVEVREQAEVALLPARIALEEEDIHRLEWASKVGLSPIPVKEQLDNLAMTVSEIRSGKKPLPNLTDFIKANDRYDNTTQIKQAKTTLQGLIATNILLPDGTLNQNSRLPSLIAQDLNRLLAIAGVPAVVESIADLTVVERVLLCDSLSVSMKEKLGNPDLDFCEPETAASYLSNAMYDIFQPIRQEYIRMQKREFDQGIDREHPLLLKEALHKRDTSMPVEVEDILIAIMERDGQNGGYASEVIDVLYQNNEKRSRSGNSEARGNVLDHFFNLMVDYCDDIDILGELRNFYSSHNATTKYLRKIEEMLNYDTT